MATTVYEVKELILDDGSTITCKPASIKVNRKGQELLSKLGDVEDNDEGVHRLLDIVCLCTKRERPEFETKDEDGKNVTNYDLMEELFDYDTMFEVIYINLGVRLNDPKLLEAAAQLAAAQEVNEESDGAS